MIQNKPGFTPNAIRPDFRKISPIGGIKRLFGPQALAEFAKSIAKLVVVGAVAMLVLWPEVDQLSRLGDMTPAAISAYTAGLILKLAFFILAVLVPLAAADLIFQRRQHEKGLKMSKQEVKEEQRQQDIAPEIKSAIRRRGMQMSRQRMLASVPSADVVITNPTHFAVALRYGARRERAEGGREGPRPARPPDPRDRGASTTSRSSRTRRSRARSTARSRSARRSRPSSSPPSPRCWRSCTAPAAASCRGRDLNGRRRPPDLQLQPGRRAIDRVLQHADLAVAIGGRDGRRDDGPAAAAACCSTC